MAKRPITVADEYSGTGSADNGVVSGPSAPIEPDSIAGSGGTTSDSGTGNFDPAIHVGPDARNSDGSYTKRKGRKPGGSNKRNHSAGKTASAADLKFALEGLTKTLVIVHAGFAAVTDTPELEIDESEAEYLARSTANVMEQFDLKPDPKTQAIIGLIVAAGTIYGPRIYMIKARQVATSKERKANAQGVGVASVLNPDGSSMGTGFTVDPRPTPAN